MDGWRPGTRLLLGGLALLVAGLGTVLAFVIGGSFFTGISGAEEHEVPATFTEQLEPGEYLVSVKFATTRSAGPVSFTRSESYNILHIDVTDPSGQPVPLRGASNQTVRRGGTSYAGVSAFDAVTPGLYTIHLEPDRPTTALVTPAFSFDDLWEVAGMGVGLMVGTLGMALAVWGFTRRRKAGRPPRVPPPPVVPPPSMPGPPAFLPPPPTRGASLPYRDL